MVGGPVKARQDATEEMLLSALQKVLGLSESEARQAMGEVRGSDRPIPREMLVTVFGSRPAPDLALGWPDECTVTIEVGHSESGAKFKDAVMHTAFHTMLGHFDLGLLVFKRRGRLESHSLGGDDVGWLEQCRRQLKVEAILL